MSQNTALDNVVTGAGTVNTAALKTSLDLTRGNLMSIDFGSFNDTVNDALDAALNKFDEKAALDASRSFVDAEGAVATALRGAAKDIGCAAPRVRRPRTRSHARR